jgi:hypothetical protein
VEDEAAGGVAAGEAGGLGCEPDCWPAARAADCRGKDTVAGNAEDDAATTTATSIRARLAIAECATEPKNRLILRRHEKNSAKNS